MIARLLLILRMRAHRRLIQRAAERFPIVTPSGARIYCDPELPHSTDPTPVVRLRLVGGC